MKHLLVIAACMAPLSVFAADSHTLAVMARQAPVEAGRLFVAAYASKANFLARPAATCSATFKAGVAQCALENLSLGRYAISAFLDLNGNGELDTGWFGIPKEPVGTSNGARGSFGPPTWADAQFALKDVLPRMELELECATSCIQPALNEETPE